MKNEKTTWKQVEPGIYRRLMRGVPTGSFYAVYSFEGERVQESLKTENLVEARRLLKIRREKDNRINPKARGLTIAGAVDKWLRTRGNRHNATTKNDRLFAHRMKTEWPGGAETLVRNVKSSDVETFVNNLETMPGRDGKRRPVGNSYRNHFGWAVRGMLELCIRDKVIDTNPASGLVSKADRATKKVPPPTFAQFEKIVASIRSQKLSDTAQASADLVEFMGKAGVGNAECAGLRWQDVDFDRGQIHLLRQKTGKAYTIKIYPRVRPLLEQMRDEAPEATGEDRVFYVRDPKKSLSRACKDLKLPHYSPRDLRRMFITDALEKDVDPGVVSRTQGHRDGGVLILKTYRHIRAKFEDDQLDRLK